MAQWCRAYTVLAEGLSQVPSTHVRYTFLRCYEKMGTEEETRIAQDCALPSPKPFFPRRDDPSFCVLYLSLVCLCKPPWPPPSCNSHITPALPLFPQRDITTAQVHCCTSEIQESRRDHPLVVVAAATSFFLCSGAWALCHTQTIAER